MRRHAKAPTAGSTKRQATGLGRFFRGAFATRHGSPRAKGSGAPKARALVLAAAVLALVLALAVGSASGSTTRFLEEVFGSASEPSFSADRGLAYDQGANHLYVIDSTADTLQRFNADGTAADFGALGSNEIDGEGAEDETAHGHLAFESNDEREQVALDESGEATDGNVYVTQASSDVIDIFNGEGEYLGQLSESTEGGEFGEPCGVAVDDEGTVYVGDRGDDLIHVFDPAAAVPVNADSAAESIDTLSNPCSLAAGAGTTAGFLFVNQSTGSAHKVDAASGEVKYEIASSVNTLTVDPSTGHVFTAHSSSTGVTEYDASEAAEATLVSAFKPGSTAEGVAVDSGSNEVFVARSSTEEVEVFGAPAVVPDVVTSPPSSNTGTRATLAGTVNPDGVELDECFFEWAVNDGGNFVYTDTVPCNETPAEIGSGTTPVAVHADLTGLVPHGVESSGVTDPQTGFQLNRGGNYRYRLLAENPNATIAGANQNFSTPKTVLAGAATAVTTTTATLNGTVNPDTAAISECVFEWGPLKGTLESFQAYPETTPCTPGPGGITGESPVAVAADIAGLHPGTVYVYRIRADYPTGPRRSSEEASLQTPGPRVVDSWAEDVLFTEARLRAEIDPEGAATTYRFEYGPTTAYGAETEELNVGADSSVHTLTRFLDDLDPGVEYHWRVVATNANGENAGPDRVMRTFERFRAETDCPNQVNRYGAGANLPDCRAYEMVSPVDKNNGDITSLEDADTVAGYALSSRTQATPTGEKLTYSSYRAFADAGTVPWSSQYIAQRTGEGWKTHSINQPGGDPVYSAANIIRAQYQVFSEDLCQAWMRSYFASPGFETTPGAENVYRREDRLCGPERFQPLAPIATPLAVGIGVTSAILSASADGSHMIYAGQAQLSPEGTTAQQLYESVEPGVTPRRVCILPGGAAWGGKCTAGSGTSDQFESSKKNAISADGERIFWTDDVGRTEGKVYVRIGGVETLPVSEAGEEEAGTTDSWFWGAAHDGSRAIYTTGDPGGSAPKQIAPDRSHLYAFDVDDEATEEIAAGVYGVMGMSEDARRVYFLSDDVLPGSGQNSDGDEAIDGRPNAYYYDADAGGGTSKFIGTLSGQDLGIYLAGSPISRAPLVHFARVTPDGLHLAFASYASLTGYDNQKLQQEEAAGSINRVAYVYDAQSEELACVSCNPSGARGLEERAKDGMAVFDKSGVPISGFEFASQPSRLLSDDGSRLFFKTNGALDPRDSNGKLDLYQWEAPGAGGCDASDPRYAPSAGGCIELISTGTADYDAEFAEATPDGDEVFFYTKSSLVPEDYGLRDIYLAKVGGGFPPPTEAPDCFGDACQEIPSPPDDPTPASAGFRGAGDPTPRRNCRPAARRAVKFSRRAKRLRRNAKRVSSQRRSRQLRRKSVRFAKSAKRLSGSATRCRRANRRANR